MGREEGEKIKPVVLGELLLVTRTNQFKVGQTVFGQMSLENSGCSSVCARL